MHLVSQIRSYEYMNIRSYETLVVEVGAELVGGGGGWATLCIKIGYSSREPRRVARPCIKIGYVSAMY